MACKTTAARRFAVHRVLEATSAVILVTFAGCGGADNTYEPPPPPKVTAIDVAMRAFEPYQDMVATVRARETVEVRARVAAFLESTEFAPGDLVSKGQVLFTLDSSEYEAAVAGATADLRAARAQLQLNREVAAKYRAAFEQGAASDIEILEAEAKVEVAAASVDQAAAKLEAARIDLSYTTISSPLDGRIGEDLVSVGNFVGRGEPTLLATVTTTEPMNVYFEITEKDFLAFRRGLIEAGKDPDPRFKYPFRVVLPDDQLYGIDGIIEFADPQIDRSTGTMTVRGTVENPDGLLRDGMFVRARIGEPVRDALALPAAAVLVDMAGEYVYVVGADGVVVRQGVETGVSVGGYQEIELGLDPGTTVIVDGILRARPGARVDAEVVDLETAMRRLDPANVPPPDGDA